MTLLFAREVDKPALFACIGARRPLREARGPELAAWSAPQARAPLCGSRREIVTEASSSELAAPM
jgi:hypothetical protein